MVAGHWYTAYMCMNGLISEALQLTTLTLFWVLLSRSQMSIACTAPSQVEIVLCRLYVPNQLRSTAIGPLWQGM